MKPAFERYRKLPGHRRGFLRGASVWIAGDHLLSVKSYRIREEYKRFHLSDVQAIVVAQCPRFHISTRSLLVAWVWFLAYLVGTYVLGAIPLAFATPYTVSMWAAGVALILVWVYISFAHSCRCRILTAVSRDELPSVYRTWTARRFLAQVEPRIAEVQGRLEGNGFEAVEAITAAPPGAPAEAPPAPLLPASRSRYFWSILFVLMLFVISVATFRTLHSPVTVVTWLSIGLLFVEMAAIVGIFMQHLRGASLAGMRWLAIAAVVKTGIGYYAGVMIMSFANANTPGISRDAVMVLPPYMLLRQLDAWADIVLGLVGLVLLVRSKEWE
jgi:hypothetical protein